MLSLKGFVHNVFSILLLTVCPLLFPRIGEQQYSYVQGLCLLSLTWLALTVQMQKCRQAMVIRSMDVAVGVCLSALFLHVFWIKPVNLSIWRWVDAVGLLALYGFVRRHCHETLERGDTVRAFRILDEAIGHIPVAGFYQQRAKLYVETGNYQKAETDYCFLRDLAPTSWDIVLELARLYRKMDRNRDALDLLEPYTKISPKDKTLEQKAVLFEMRELYGTVHSMFLFA